MNTLQRVTAAVMSALLMILSSEIAAAQVVTVNGYGISETAAINDAKRNAVEQVVGTVLKSRSVAQDLEFVMDVIDTRTQGYVNGFEIIKKSRDGSNFVIQAKIDVSNEPNSSLMKDVELVMSLNDPRLGVVTEYYGDDGGESFKKFPAMTSAAIREELIKRGFSHVVDSKGEVDYIIIGNLTVNKAKSVKLPSWTNISGDDYKTQDTGWSKTTAAMDGKIKKFDTDEIIGEFHVTGDSMAADSDEIQSLAVQKMSTNAAQEVRKIFNREASKVFKSVKIVATIDNGDKVLRLEELLRQADGVNSVYVRGFHSGECTIDVGTDLAPQQLYQTLAAVIGDEFSLKMNGFSSTTLEISVRACW